MMSNTTLAEKKVIIELTELLKKNSEKVLSGETKLCLTTSSLSVLAANFRRYSENASENNDEASNTSGKKKKGRPEEDGRVWRESMRTLIDFVINVKAVKIIMGSNTMKAPVQINRFKSLQVLEVKKVPIHMLEGLSKLRGQLKEITVSKSLQTLKDLLEICGGDRTLGLVWSNLKSVYLGFNLLQKLDQSLSFIPFAEIIDLSHNSITSTDDYLTVLTDIVRINFGYNLLKTIPQFSSGNLTKLKTIVLRNNNLENIDGIEAFIGLEELDLAENFLLDHKLLFPLSKLKKLQVLCLTGNPLSFKEEHRLLTLTYICSHAGHNVFYLDGKKLNSQESVMVTQNQFRYDREYTPDDDTDRPKSDSYQDDSVIVSHLSPHGKKKKKGHRRKRSMERIPKITDVQDASIDDVSPQSGVAPSSSQLEESTTSNQKQEDEEYFKTIREHYQEDWLKALTVTQIQVHQEDDVTSDTINIHNDGTENKNVMSTVEKDDKLTKDKEDVKSTIGENIVQPARQDSVMSAVSQDSVSSVVSPTKPTTMKQISFEITENTDIYSLSSKNKPPGRSMLYSQESLESVHSPTEEDSQQYGPESDPFIVMLPDKDMKEMFITVNKRFLNEKDINNTKTEKLDLKYLQSIRSNEETCYSRNIIDGCVFTVLTLQFDYTRKDLRQRRYAMESKQEAKDFESLINHHLKSQSDILEQMECLKCQYEFMGTEDQDSKSFTRCPKCDSKLVIKVSKSPVIKHNKSPVPMETVDEDVSNTKLRDSRNLTSEREDNSSKDSGRDIETTKKSSFHERFSGSLKEHADKLCLDDSNQDVVDALAKSEPSGLKLNLSSSELKKSASSQGRGSVTSVESDIAVLPRNSSREVISAISESTHENVWLTDSADSKNQNMASTDDALESDRVTTGAFNDHVTPVGSPLSTIVCNSMVSSVYKNTLSPDSENCDNTENNDSKTEEKGSFEDDIIAEPVKKRRSRKSDRKSNNRGLGIYDNLVLSDQVDSSTTSNTSVSIFDSSNVSQTNVSKSEEVKVSQNEASSIYDTALTHDNSEYTQSNFESLNSTNQNTSIQSHDSLSVNPMSSSHSSPLRRAGSMRRSRSSSRNRSAIYVENSAEVGQEGDSVSSNTLDFPNDLSPIKRPGSRSSRSNNRSGIVVDGDLETSQSLSAAMSSTTNDESSATDVTNTSQEASNVLLPWEQTSSQSTDDVSKHKDESLNHDEFVNIDHNIKLYLELQVFKADETAQCAIQCNIVQYMKTEEIKSLLVISTHRIMIFCFQGNSNDSDWLKCYEDQPISELQYIDIGLGYQTLRLEFDTVCSSFTLLIADEGRCKQFFTLMSDIVQKEADSGHSQLQRITKSNPDTLENLTVDVLTTEDDVEPQTLVKYLIVRYQTGENDPDNTKLMSLVVTESDIVLVDENHQWPLPRLQASLSEDIKGRQFTVIQREKINNIETLMFNEYNHAELQLTFFETSSPDATSVWIISFETIKGVKHFVDAIRDPWQEEFGVSLDIKSTNTSLADNSSTT
ncbi:protein kinase binding [Mactra antiquata]